VKRNLKGFSNTSSLGEYAESVVISHFLKAGFNVNKPIGSLRYDLIIEHEGRCLKVQVKVGFMRGGSVEVKRHSGGINRIKVFYSKEQVDLFAIYCYELNRVYIIGFDEKVNRLRIFPSKNNQKIGIHPAEKYEFCAERIRNYF
jgi:hypothetical protein